MNEIKIRAGRWWPEDVAEKVNELVREYNKMMKIIKQTGWKVNNKENNG